MTNYDLAVICKGINIRWIAGTNQHNRLAKTLKVTWLIVWILFIFINLNIIPSSKSRCKFNTLTIFLSVFPHYFKKLSINEL